jgi:hypothetical protein
MKRLNPILNMLGAVALLATTLALASCADPAIQDRATGNTGSLSISIPATASWITELQAELQSDQKGDSARAMARCSSAKVTINDTAGTTVNTQTVYPSGYGSTATLTLSQIPVGTDYAVTVDILNSYVSTSSPTVRGTITGVDIVESQNTAVSCVCLPVAPTAIAADSTTAVSLGYGKEAWFQVSLAASTPWYIYEDFSDRYIALFASTGKKISANAELITYTPKTDETVYVCLYQDTYNTTGDSTLTATTTMPEFNEGSTTRPIELALDAVHSFLLGPPSLNQEYSFYAFTTDNAGIYAIKFDKPFYGSVNLYSDAAFLTSTTITKSVYYGFYFTASAATKYYLRLDNSSGIKTITGTLVGPTATAVRVSGGTEESPTSLTLSQVNSCTVGSNPWDDTGYYSFLTNSTDTAYRLIVDATATTGHSWDTDVYSDNGYSIPVGNIYVMGACSMTKHLQLAKNTTYYIKLRNTAANANTFGVSAIPYTPNVSDIALDTWTQGELSPAQGVAWYRIAVSESTTYTVYCDDSWGGTGTISTEHSILMSDMVTAYETNIHQNNGAVNGNTITTSAGETYLYIMVAPIFSSNSGTFKIKVTKN